MDIIMEALRALREEKEVCPKCGKEVCVCKKIKESSKKLVCAGGLDANPKDKYYVVAWDGQAEEDEDLGEYNTLKEAEQAAKDAVELDGYAVAEVHYKGQLMRHFGLGESLKEEYSVQDWQSLKTEVERDGEAYYSEIEPDEYPFLDDSCVSYGADVFYDKTWPHPYGVGFYWCGDSGPVGDEPYPEIFFDTFEDMKAYLENNCECPEGIKCFNESLNEDVASTMPVTPLPHDEVMNFIRDVKPGEFFNVGYLKEFTDKLASMYKGGRGSINKETGDVAPNVRVFKCTEMYGCTGVDYENKQATIDMRAATGKERVGNKYEFDMSAMPLKVGVTASGKELLQFYPKTNSHSRVKWFISLNDEDLRECDKNEVAQYMSPAAANMLLNPVERPTDGTAGTMINRLDVNGIYRIGNLGNSIM